jgi:hypothetical protein
MLGTAPPARRLFLIEVPGPWGRTALTDSRLDRYTSGRVADAADHAGVRVLLIRRPGRHAAVPGQVTPKAWAVVDTTPGRQEVRWGTWLRENDLLDVDLHPRPGPPPGQRVSQEGSQALALVCTHGRHDVCCALRGRPVAMELAENSDWDVWECSHLGGDRFAANVLLLPDGELFGGMDASTAVSVVTAAARGRVVLGHYRGRLGRPPVEQAALHHAMVALGEDRRDAVQVLHSAHRHEAVHEPAAVALGADPDGEGWTVDVRDGAGTRHRLTLVTTWSRPEQLTCSAGGPARVRRFELTAMEALGA